ncbi:uncharacterized protein LOC126835925 isoform X2 [Adelges cooleyi]|nr:uncharacterized protein LOC126835925 isoform X2 [Adelges cooleyi]
MNLQKLVSILVWVAAIRFTRVISDVSELKKLELIEKLNTLLSHPGWQIMYNVNIVESYMVGDETNEAIGCPMSAIYEAVRSNRKPVDELNVWQRYDQVWTVLRCKYAEVIERYRVLIKHLMGVCRNEKKEDKKAHDPSLQRYFNCFHLLLNNLQVMSPRFKCMADALELFYSIGPQTVPRQNVMVAMQKLTEFTSTVMSDTVSKLSIRDIDEYAVNLEIKAITKFLFVDILVQLQWFIEHYCEVPSLKNWNLKKDFDDKRRNGLIPLEMTMLQYVQGEIDYYVDEIFCSMFYNLGFAYDDTGNVIIRIDS